MILIDIKAIDPRPYHDHGPFTGPCSNQKHELVRFGIRDQGQLAEPVEEWYKRVFYFTRQIDGGVACACCGWVYPAATPGPVVARI